MDRLNVHLLEEEDLALFVQIYQKVDLKHSTLRLSNDLPLEKYVKYLKPDIPTKLRVFGKYASELRILNDICKSPNITLMYLEVRSEDLQVFSQPDDCDAIFEDLECLKVTDFRLDKHGAALRAICEKHANFQLELLMTNTDFFWWATDHPNPDVIANRTRLLDMIFCEPDLTKLGTLCKAHPHLKLRLEAFSGTEMKQLVYPQYDSVIQALEVFQTHRPLNKEGVDLLRTICRRNTTVRLRLSPDSLLHVDEFLLQRSYRLDLSWSLFQQQSEEKMFINIRERFPDLEYKLSPFEFQQDQSNFYTPPGPLVARIPPELVLPHSKYSRCSMLCKPATRGLQIASERLQNQGRNGGKQTLELAIGGCKDGLMDETLRTMKKRSKESHLIVNWLGPSPPTSGFSTALAEAIKDTMPRLKSVTLQVCIGCLVTIEQTSEILQKALQARCLTLDVSVELDRKRDPIGSLRTRSWSDRFFHGKKFIRDAKQYLG